MVDNIPVPRNDISKQFLVYKEKDLITLKYGNPDGVSGLRMDIDQNGILGFDIRSAPDHPYMNESGIDMFSSAMKRIEEEGIVVDKIRGAWVSGTDSVNTAQYIENINKGLSPTDAALNTWTGKMAQRYGFNKVEEIKDNGGIIYVIFGK